MQRISSSTPSAQSPLNADAMRELICVEPSLGRRLAT
jgi:hypothetical protein